MSSFETLPPSPSTQPGALPAPEGASGDGPCPPVPEHLQPCCGAKPDTPNQPSAASLLMISLFSGWRDPRGFRREEKHRENAKGEEDGCVGAARGQPGLCLRDPLLGRERSVHWCISIKPQALLQGSQGGWEAVVGSSCVPVG